MYFYAEIPQSLRRRVFVLTAENAENATGKFLTLSKQNQFNLDPINCRIFKFDMKPDDKELREQHVFLLKQMKLLEEEVICSRK